MYNSKSKVTAGVLAILLGSLGIHKFYLDYTSEGIAMLLISLLGGIVSCGIAASVMAIFGLIEGIIYLTMDDEKFYYTYVAGHKGWF